MEDKRIEKAGIRDILSVDAAKVVNTGLHLLGKQGTTLPGKAALAISPSILEKLASQIRKKTFAVCGTNGKTTVNNLLCVCLETEGNSVVCNRLGANMQNGIASAYTETADALGNLLADYACLEIDEAASAMIFPLVKPDYMILTNLFRDQLDRYGEIDIIMEKLLCAIRMVPAMKLIVNADDPLSVFLAQKSGHPFVTYGISDRIHGHEDERAGEIREARFCKKCGALLHYDFYHYSQMGVWHCPECSFARPDPDYEASDISSDGGLSFRIGDQQVSTGMKGIYSVYNILAIYSALSESGQGDLLRNHLQEALSNYHPQFGRGERFTIHGKKAVLSLAKNPAGFNQNIAAVLEDKEPKDLIIAINDNAQDGRDISWLWDVDFDLLSDESVQSITVSGIRSLDLSLRFKYVGIRTEVVEKAQEAIETKLKEGTGNLYVLVNYTALFDIHQILKKMEEQGSGR